MVSERQLSILGPDGCIGNDLSHKVCMIKEPRRGFETDRCIFDVNDVNVESVLCSGCRYLTSHSSFCRV